MRAFASIVLVLILFLAGGPADGGSPKFHETERYVVDGAQARLYFETELAGLLPVGGDFSRLSGEAIFARGDLRSSRVKISVAVASLGGVGESARTHLMGPAFFDAARFPEIAYRGERLSRIDRDRYRLEGRMTLRGVSRPVVFELAQIAAADGEDGQLRLVGAGEISRADFGMTGGRPIIGDRVRLSFSLALRRSPQSASAGKSR